MLLSKIKYTKWYHSLCKTIRRLKRMLSELVLLSFLRGTFLTFSIELIELFYVLVYFYVLEVCARNYYIYQEPEFDVFCWKKQGVLVVRRPASLALVLL